MKLSDAELKLDNLQNTVEMGTRSLMRLVIELEEGHADPELVSDLVFAIDSVILRMQKTARE